MVPEEDSKIDINMLFYMYLFILCSRFTNKYTNNLQRVLLSSLIKVSLKVGE